MASCKAVCDGRGQRRTELLRQRFGIAQHRRGRALRASSVRSLRTLRRALSAVLVEEGAADAAVALESARQLEPFSLRNRDRVRDHR